jgi:N-acetylglutamate synthase/N-acetylornithine aminotransferase
VVSIFVFVTSSAAIGSYMGKYMPDADVSQMSLSLGDQCIFSNGKFVLEGDEVGSTAMVGETSSVVVLGSDLTQEYVVINADYRS